MRPARVVIPVVCLATACSLPPFEYEGEHVVIASNVVDQVCAGTIDRLDRGVEHIDEQLGLPESDERVPVAILELSDAWRLCGRGRAACADDRGTKTVAVLSPGTFERAAVHEMAHTRVGSQRSGNVALFNEGIAVAVSPAFCAHYDELPSADELLPISSGWDLSNTGYYLGGELVTWLLETHGPDRVMSFIATLQRPEALSPSAEPEFVRSSYRSHFGSELDEDLHAHLREPDQISPEGLGCLGPKATWSGDRVRLTANLDCDSVRVQNDFLLPDRVYVDWTLEVPETETPRRHRLLDNLPDDTWLEIRPCTCDLHDERARVEWTDETSVGSTVGLAPGTYLIRWHGGLDDDAELEIMIEAYDEQ